MKIETITGVAASICTAASLLPQLIKILKDKKAENISMGMMLILFVGSGLWIYYGILKHDIIIIISNSFSFVVNILLAIFSVKYKQQNKISNCP